MRVERATPADLDRVVDLWVDLARGQRQFGSHLLATANRDAIYRTLAGHVADGTLLVARDDGAVGFVAFELQRGRFSEDVTRGVVHNIYVEPESRNRGIGSTLLGAAETALTAAGADVVALEVLAENAAARRLYRRRGYQPHRVEYERSTESDTHVRDEP